MLNYKRQLNHHHIIFGSRCLSTDSAKICTVRKPSSVSDSLCQTPRHRLLFDSTDFLPGHYVSKQGRTALNNKKNYAQYLPLPPPSALPTCILRQHSYENHARQGNAHNTIYSYQLHPFKLVLRKESWGWKIIWPTAKPNQIISCSSKDNSFQILYSSSRIIYALHQEFERSRSPQISDSSRAMQSTTCDAEPAQNQVLRLASHLSDTSSSPGVRLMACGLTFDANDKCLTKFTFL